jgi:DNA-binding transcriptional ArsR family regulator
MPLDPLSSTFAALADPTRRAILARLALGETSVMELAKPFDMSLPAISKHLKVLEHAGLISRGARGAVAAVPDRARLVQAGRRLAREFPPLLGRELQPPRRIARGDEGGGGREGPAAQA